MGGLGCEWTRRSERRRPSISAPLGRGMSTNARAPKGLREVGEKRPGCGTPGRRVESLQTDAGHVVSPQHQRPLDHVLELADVAGPLVREAEPRTGARKAGQ